MIPPNAYCAREHYKAHSESLVLTLRWTRSKAMSLHPFTAYVLRKYNEAIGFKEDNLYSNLTRSSDGVLL